MQEAKLLRIANVTYDCSDYDLLIKSGYWDGNSRSLEILREGADCIKCHLLTPKTINSLDVACLNVSGTVEK